MEKMSLNEANVVTEIVYSTEWRKEGFQISSQNIKNNDIKDVNQNKFANCVLLVKGIYVIIIRTSLIEYMNKKIPRDLKE